MRFNYILKIYLNCSVCSMRRQDAYTRKFKPPAQECLWKIYPIKICHPTGELYLNNSNFHYDHLQGFQINIDDTMLCDGSVFYTFFTGTMGDKKLQLIETAFSGTSILI